MSQVLEDKNDLYGVEVEVEQHCLAFSARSAPISFGGFLEAVFESDPDSEPQTDPGFFNSSPVYCDDGPERLALRVPSVLQGPEGEYVGDGMQGVTVLGDGLVLLGLVAGVPGLMSGAGLTSIGWRFLAGEGELIPVACGGTFPDDGSCSFSQVGDWLILKNEGNYFGISWVGEQHGWLAKLGGEGLWSKIGDGKTAPFFHGWENCLCQGGASAGWQEHQGASLEFDGESLLVAWHSGEARKFEPGTRFSGNLALAWGLHEKDVRQRLEALAAPVVPEISGGVLCGYDFLEGSIRVRTTSEKCSVRFPEDPMSRRVLLRFDTQPTGAFDCLLNGQALRPQLLSLGRVDDPYGPHEGRPDSHSRPLLAQFEKPAERVVLGVDLSATEPTEVSVEPAEGLSLSYLSQDDRRELLLFSSSDSAPLGRLSLADLKFRDLRLPGSDAPALAMLPFYWFMMNAPSAYHSVNLLENWKLVENGPEQVALTLASSNPGGGLYSTFAVRMRMLSGDRLLLNVKAGLETLQPLPLPHFQFCNVFPEHSRMPGDWGHPQTLVASREDLWVVDNRKKIGSESTAAGKRFKDFSPPFFLSQFGCPQGNFALLVKSIQPQETPCHYELCRCWLDDHLYISFPEGGLPAGVKFSVSYDLLLWGKGSETQQEITTMSRAALESGSLEVL
jgi:hypothetical protein